MPNVIDNAIARVQALALALTSVAIKSAPTYPIENADPFPFAVAFLGGGTTQLGDATTVRVFPSINVEFHFSRVNLITTYTQINAVALEFSQRLAGDPTLGGNVSTLIGSSDNPITWSARPFDWGSVKSQALVFVIPFKTLQTPQATST